MYDILPLEEGHCVISNVCFMRSSAALVYNCKQARIVLAGTNFATTEALAFLRSAELARSIQKRQFLKTEGFSSRCMVYCSTMGEEPPPNFFREKSSRPPLRGTAFLSFLF